MHKHTAKQLTFFSIYVAQSVPMSLISTLLPVLMRQQNFTLTSIGLLQLIKLPWILKLFWAPLVDRHTHDLRSYKRWIWGSELVYALMILGVALLDLRLNFPLVLALVVLAFAASATQDIATDALTSRVFREDTIGANRLQSMGQFAGTIIGGGLLMIAYKYLGWQALLCLVALLVLLLLIPLGYYREDLQGTMSSDGEVVPKRVGWQDIVNFFARPRAGRRVILLLLFNAGLVGIMAMMKPYLVDVGYALVEIGMLFTLYGAGCGFVASWLAGRYLKAIPRRRALLIAAMSIVLASGGIALCVALDYHSLPFVLLMFALLWGSYGISTVVLYAVAMDYVRAGREGTDFTLQIVLLHLSSLLVASLSGKLAQALGYPIFFSLECLLAVISLLYVLAYRKDEASI